MNERATPSDRARIHRTRPEDGAATRQALIAVATELFSAQGYEAVALQAVCDRANVTRGALYHHFPGKRELFRAVCETLANKVEAAIRGSSSQATDAWSGVRRGCETFLDVSLRPEVRQILLADAPSVLGWAVSRQLDMEHGLGLLTARIAASVDDGLIPPVPIEATAHLIVAALNEAALMIGAADDRTRMRHEAGVTVERLLAGFASG